ncbi:HD domain-containing protein [Actinophytocola oryzae]|uniref:Histidine kinase/DNA gyrase B/HSP90-like ATPase n=1 Tax=Actinophytocola oryzae TaxID=502181 RepID=A0A4R7V2V3_9PSEU|nr:hypothetical protein [Actinophytocola oryzae]TDV43708.1 hypothetical protein CLV71_115171 [Actinophytocola oryzae]
MGETERVGTTAQQRAAAVLAELRKLAGSPKYDDLLARCANSNVSPIGRGTITSLLTGKTRARPATLTTLVVLCLDYARAHPKMSRLKDEQNNVDYWINRYDAALGRTAASSGEDVWTRLIEHEVWRAVRTDGVPSMGDHAVAVARRLVELQGEAEPILADDRWHDLDFASRMSERMADLVTSLKDLDLSAAEAALLVLAPFACQADATLRAARMIGARPADLVTEPRPGEDPNRVDYMAFLRREPCRRLVRRANGQATFNGAQASGEIGWWLYHYWLGSRRSTEPVFRALLDDPAIGTDSTRRLLVELLDPLLRVVRVSPEQLRSLDQLGLDAGPGDCDVSAPSRRVRERLVALLVKLAYVLAIPLTALPAVVAEHLGIPHPVDLDDLRNTVRMSSWPGMTLKAECHHEAVLVALQEHAAHVDAVVRSISAVATNDVSLEPLRKLPAVGASADKVVAARDSLNHPRFMTPVDRFRLDEQRVRELLMDRNLYRDPALAIRELYQNALDACRLREARQRCRGTNLGWKGQIDFIQGIDDATGRHYLECRDTGVGMDAADLRGAFSHVGVRYIDSPEFLHDEIQFHKYGVEFVPNSRFGIGVISYFMLADEIEVETCRMAYNDRLQGVVQTVTIVGPGHLFRIQENPSTQSEPGTRVRLYLQDGDRAPSCVDLLRKVLGIAQYRTTATHDDQQDDQHDVWEPDVLHARARPAFDQDGIDAFGHSITCSKQDDGQVIWCEHGGALLIDGIYVRAANHHGGLSRPGQEDDLRGAVVNLTGNPQPELSIDRSLVLDDVSHRIKRLLTGAIHKLVEDAPAFLRTEWIHDVAQSSPWVADLVTKTAATSGTLLSLGNDKPSNTAVTGCFPPDIDLFTPDRDDFHDWKHRGRRTHRLTYDAPLPNLNTDRCPDHIALWRWLAHHPAEALDQLTDIAPEIAPGIDVLPALPSDAVLLADDGNWSRGDERAFDPPPPPGHLLWTAAATGTSPRKTAERAVVLGMRDVLPDQFSTDPHLDSTELALLSHGLEGQRPWLTTDEPVPVTHFLEARRRLRLSVAESADRLSRYGFTVPSADRLSYLAHLNSDQIKLLSHNLDGEAPWIQHRHPVAFAHLVKASLELDYNIAEAVDQLDRLGFHVAVPADLPPQLDANDLRLISAQFDGNGPWLDYDKPVPPDHLIAAPPAFGGPRKVAERLTALGFTVRGLDRIPEHLSDIDQEIEREDRTGMDDIFEVTKPVQATSLFLIAMRMPGYRVRDVAERLTCYGFEVADDVIRIAEQLTAADLKLLSRDHDEQRPWLDVTKTVPTAHLIRPSLEADRRPTDIAQQLRRWNFDVTEPPDLPTQLTPEDRQLVHDHSRDDWLDVREPVPLHKLIMAARRTRTSVTAAARRLRQLGFDVPNLASAVQQALARLPRQ